MSRTSDDGFRAFVIFSYGCRSTPWSFDVSAVGEFNAALTDAGAFVFAGGLNPPSTAKTVDVTSGEPRVLDEPFVRADSYRLGAATSISPEGSA